MRYLERFTYWIIDSPIFEMALYRKDAINKIRSLSGTILTHIIKVKYIKDESYIDHWIFEIRDYFRSINRIEIKPFNRKFTNIEYLEFLLVEPYCSSDSSAKKNKFIFLEKHTKRILDDINIDYNTNIKYDQVDFTNIVNFFKKICESIANDEDINKIIDEEFKK